MDSPEVPEPTLADVQAAALRIAPYVHRTPVFTSSHLDEVSGARLFFKCENLQKVGAFKMRGATNFVLQLSSAQAARGVVTHSSGNHGQAVAAAAGVRGVAATVVMPRSSAAVKRAAVGRLRGAGGAVCRRRPGARRRGPTDRGAGRRHPHPPLRASPHRRWPGHPRPGVARAGHRPGRGGRAGRRWRLPERDRRGGPRAASPGRGVRRRARTRGRCGALTGGRPHPAQRAAGYGGRRTAHLPGAAHLHAAAQPMACGF